MTGGRKKTSLNTFNSQIEIAQENVIKAKRKYDECTGTLKALLDKRKEIQSKEIMEEIVKSTHSYEEILRYIRSDSEESDE